MEEAGVLHGRLQPIAPLPVVTTLIQDDPLLYSSHAPNGGTSDRPSVLDKRLVTCREGICPFSHLTTRRPDQ